MTQITLNGKTYKLGFNLATWLAYEQATGHSIIEDLAKIHDDLNNGRYEGIIKVAVLELSTSNMNEEINVDEVMSGLDNQEKTIELINAASTEMLAYINPEDKMLKDREASKEGQKKQKKSHRPTNSIN